jgi:hypothetical protein
MWNGKDIKCPYCGQMFAVHIAATAFRCPYTECADKTGG